MGGFYLFSIEEVLSRLRAAARPNQLEGMARYGINIENRLGVSIPELRKLAKEVGKNHDLALELWKIGIADARILASMIDDPTQLTEAQMEAWVKDIDSWDVGDQVCMNLFEKTPLAWSKIDDWSRREEEFVKRSAYGLLACLAWHDKKAENHKFLEMLTLIGRGALDERNSIKKAVSWALRNIGKRNLELNEAALAEARRIRFLDSKSARWIASEAIRELESERVKNRLSKKK